MTPEFRYAVFQFRYDENRDGKERTCIALQLQRFVLFLFFSPVCLYCRVNADYFDVWGGGVYYFVLDCLRACWVAQ